MKIFKDAEYQAAIDKAVSDALAVMTAERDGFKTRAEASEEKLKTVEAGHASELKQATDKLVAMEAEHKAALEKLSDNHKAAMEAKDKSVNTIASQKAAAIAKTAGLDAPIVDADTKTATDITGLREQLAVEKDPTKKANLSREIRRLTDAAKSKK